MPVSRTLDGGRGMSRGDVYSVRRTVNSIPAGVTLTKAWLMVKATKGTADGSATISKEITSTDSAGTGQIEDTGADGSGVLRFDLTNTNTTAVTAGTVYYYAIKVKFSNSDALTLEEGTQTWAEGVVQAYT